MKVKRFVGPTLQDAMIKVKLEMGKDAVIIHTRKFKEGGFLGLFGKDMIEVTAALEEGRLQAMEPKPVHLTPPPKLIPQTGSGFNLQSSLAIHDENKFQETNDSEIQKEITEMKQIISQMAEQMEHQRPLADYPPALQKYYQLLSNNEVEDKVIRKLLKKVEDSLEPDDLFDDQRVRASLEEFIKRVLKSPKPMVFKEKNKQIIVLVGPTGVGKTTTIAKLAATFSIVDKKKVGLITADTYRIAAVEQLKTFGEIIGVPVDVVYTPQELIHAVDAHQNKDLIIIDTAGRSHKNESQMEELKSFLMAANPSEIFLVLSATTKSRDLLDIIDSYADINVGRLIFTKIDETTSCGVILNSIDKTKKNLSYITTGQSVPDDIEIADTDKIARMILKEYL